MMFKKEILDLLSMQLTADESMLEIPPQPGMGDYAFPCFTLAKEFKKSPAEIAKEIASKLTPNDIVVEIRAEGPYVNFYLNKAKVAEKAIE